MYSQVIGFPTCYTPFNIATGIKLGLGQLYNIVYFSFLYINSLEAYQVRRIRLRETNQSALGDIILQQIQFCL